MAASKKPKRRPTKRTPPKRPPVNRKRKVRDSIATRLGVEPGVIGAAILGPGTFMGAGHRKAGLLGMIRNVIESTGTPPPPGWDRHFTQRWTRACKWRYEHTRKPLFARAA